MIPADLFEQPKVGAFPTPRPFQDTAHTALREGFKRGHRNQLLVAPTGSGKTVIGLRIIHEALQKGKRALFVCDRTALIDQTSARADSYGLTNHAIVQADHWRRDNTLPFQIASIQTIQARGYWPEADVIVIDEAHTQYGATKELLERATVPIIGLTATPCTKGLGKFYASMVNAATMHELTETGVLVPLRILSCTVPDMTGAKTSGGEWTNKAAAEREAKIIGDVVAEWSKYGEGRKTIAFGADIAYCTALVQRFNDAGIMAATFTADTPKSERDELLKEFNKPDSAIRILVSVEALAKGFDVPDIGCVIDARPLRKSLSTAIQMWGRGLRSSPGKVDCIARGTLVLTDRGEVPIEHVTLDHKVWDGENYVSHAGAVCRGVRRVIEHDGLIATPDHRVMTDDGWTRFEEAATRQLRIARTGNDGRAVRLADDLLTRDPRKRLRFASRGAMRTLWRQAFRSLPQHQEEAGHGGMSTLQCATTGAGAQVAIRTMPRAAEPMPQSERFGIRAIWRAWNRVSLFVSQRRGALGSSTLGCAEPRNATGPQGQRWALRAWESALDHSGREPEQHASVWWARALHCLSQVISRCSIRRRDAGPATSYADARRSGHALERALAQTEREVWDVFNAGPLQRFTANGRLVHNCILLDHSGNIRRFLPDFEDIYHNGFRDLDSSEKLDAKPREEIVHEAKGCPSCGRKPFIKQCLACGFAKPAQVLEDATVGQMEEIRFGKGGVAANSKMDLWRQCCGYARAHSAPEKQQWRAKYLYQDMTGERPPASFATTESAPVSKATRNKIQQKNIAYAKRRAAEAAQHAPP